MTPALLTDTVTFDLERAVHYTLLWGLEGVELRRVGGAHSRVPDVNESVLKRRLMESELDVVAADPGIFGGPAEDRAAWLNELVSFDEILGFCRRIGCPRVVVSSLRGDLSAREASAGAIRQAAKRAAAHGVAVCVLNEPDAVARDGRALAELLDEVDVENATAAWDPAAALQAGEHPLDGLAALEGRIGFVRCRNGHLEGNEWQARSIDDGEIDWPAHVRRLRAQHFDGPISLEVSTEPRGRQGLHDATVLIQYLRNAERANE